MKRCTFTSNMSEQFTGAYMGQGQSCTLGYTTTLGLMDWMLPYMTDGARTYYQNFPCSSQPSSYLRWDQSFLTWKGRPEKISFLAADGFSLVYIPIAQVYSGGVWKDDPWAWFSRNGKAGAHTSTLYRCNRGDAYAAPDCAGKAGRVVRAIWQFGPQQTYWGAGGAVSQGQFVSSGTAKDGSQWRQTWIENSPGTSCSAPGSVRIEASFPVASEYGDWKTTN